MNLPNTDLEIEKPAGNIDTNPLGDYSTTNIKSKKQLWNFRKIKYASPLPTLTI